VIKMSKLTDKVSVKATCNININFGIREGIIEVCQDQASDRCPIEWQQKLIRDHSRKRKD